MTKKHSIGYIIATIFVVAGIGIFICACLAGGEDLQRYFVRDYETNIHEVEESFQNILIQTDTADIVFVRSENGECKVECYEEKERKHEVMVKDGALSIKEIDERKWYEHISLFSFASPKITVYLPEEQYKEMTIRQSTGDVTIPNGFMFESIQLVGSTGAARCYASVEKVLQINRSTGAVEAGNLTAEQLKIEVSTGHIDVVEVACEDIDITVSTGFLKMVEVSCQNLKTTGDTGDITLCDVLVQNLLYAERSTGDIYFERCDAKEIKMITDTGDVEGTLLSEKIFYIDTDTGSVDVPKTLNGGLCEITTDTGDIRIEIVK